MAEDYRPVALVPYGPRPMFEGLTIREHFAGLAMQALLNNSNYSHKLNPESISKASFAMSDAMIEAGRK